MSAEPIERSAAPEGGAHARTVLHGVFLNLLSYLLTRGINLLITIMLARVLAPEGMGLIAAALLAIELIDIVYGFGLREMLIFDSEADRRRQSTAFVIICVIAVIQMLLMLAAAPWSASIVDDPLIVPIMMLLSLLFPINSIGAVHEAILLKTLQFKKAALAEIVSIIAKATVALSLLFLGYGVWSFVAGMFAAQVTRTGAFWLFCDWRPSRPDLMWSSIVRQLRYGQHIVLTGSIVKLRQRSDQLSIVTAMGDASLGVYFVASRIPDIVLFGVSVTLSKIVFPTFASVAGDRDRLAGMYLNTIFGSMLLMAPIAFGVMCTAPLVVQVFFGEEWSAATPVLVVLAFSGIPRVVGWTAGDVFKATGRPDILAYLNIAQTALVAPIVVILAVTTQDLVIISLGVLAGEIVGMCMNLWAMRRFEGVAILPTLTVTLKPILAAFVMGSAVIAVISSFEGLGTGISLVSATLIGMVIYPIVVFAIDGRNCIRWLKIIAPRRLGAR